MSSLVAPPATVGASLMDVATPALLLDLDIFERNAKILADRMTAFPNVRVRPHFKAHKVAEIALLQMEQGAIGVCCQTVAEAEFAAKAGVPDVLLSNEVVPAKVGRVARAARLTKLTVCVDCEAAVDELSAAAKAEGAHVNVVVELDMMDQRCGINPQDIDEVVAVARRVVDAPNVAFAGIQAYHGAVQHVRPQEERQAVVDRNVARITPVLTALERAGIPAGMVTGGGTGTFEFEAASGVYTEVQPGSAWFMDADYPRNEGGVRFENALFLLGTVLSTGGKSTTGRVVLDAGHKSQSKCSGPPAVHSVLSSSSGAVRSAADMAGTFEGFSVSDEHCHMCYSGDDAAPVRNDRVLLIPGHVDPTMNLHDHLVAMRKGVVEAVWRILRGSGV